MEEREFYISIITEKLRKMRIEKLRKVYALIKKL